MIQSQWQYGVELYIYCNAIRWQQHTQRIEDILLSLCRSPSPPEPYTQGGMAYTPLTE